MRTQSVIDDIVNRAKTGYVVLQQTLAADREIGYIDQLYQERVYIKLMRCKKWIDLIAFDNFTLAQKSTIADRIIRENIVATDQTIQEWMQSDFDPTFIDFTD